MREKGEEREKKEREEREERQRDRERGELSYMGARLLPARNCWVESRENANNVDCQNAN